MIRIDDLIYSARQLACVRPARCGRIHLLWPCIGIDGEGAGWMRADATGLGKAKRIVVGDQDVFRSWLAAAGRPFTTPRVNCQVPDSSS